MTDSPDGRRAPRPIARSAPHLGFIVIGAQKAGTTSLFEYLRRHPGVYMPPQKEIGFFSGDCNYARGWDWYSTIALDNAPAGTVCGEASVGYMSGTPDLRPTGNGFVPVPPDPDGGPHEDIIPQRIREHVPDVKLICVLRDPVARCYSHYRMTVLAGDESRPFEQAVTEMLAPEELEKARTSITGSNGYIVRGEYFRILSGYWRTFRREQLLTIFSGELDTNPAAVLARLFEFIGVGTDFVPDNLGVRYREAALARRVPGLDLYRLQRRLSEGRLTRRMWHALPGLARPRIGRAYERASFRVEMWNARRGRLHDDMSADVRKRLIEHFRSDSEALGGALGVAPPWLSNWRVAAGQ
jgi:hypothetical protein